ncbi:sensor domain-containing diguanylate cyclase [Planococcus kocurii]|uniref:GGDEF domain-containing protein n=1 Tax=Planococcus faecalis TaxID=1598147 RepID=A0ABM6IRR7_9BACL|nr:MULTISPECIES: sensor domain-containing diguanylate cyclase [Planococcus]AQU79280.1 hypothetical protein AJGP001_08380 [Planococcus faecalis]KAA0955206.1 GGDEF domain-containing protein [Planococcus sp. ANT_H30]OHX52314.1 hypothetical protein BB777_12975 [Planococcus faecalis]
MRKTFTTRKVSLATLLSLLVSVSVISTLLILTISTYHSNKESLTSTYLALNFSKAKKMSHSVDSLFISMRTHLESTAEFLEDHEEMTDPEIQEQLELLRVSSGYFNSLSWVDETGVIRVNSPGGIGLQGTKITSGVTKDVLDARVPMLTKPYVGPSNQLLVLMSQPIYSNNGTYRGMIGGTIYLQKENALNQILDNEASDTSGSHYYVVGPNGILLFHPQSQRIGENFYEHSLVRKIAEGKSGTEIAENAIGVSMLSAYSYVPEAGWGIVQQTPYSFVENLLLTELRQLLMKVLVPFLFLLLLSILIARKLAAPFNRLGTLVNRLAEGKPIFQSEKEVLTEAHWNREADLLTKSVGLAFETIEKNNLQLTQSAQTDSLTGLLNRRNLDEVLSIWSAESRLFSLLVLDIDHFKSVNDTYGHQVGDKVLKMMAETLCTVVRKNDVCFRYGGEEFVILLPHTDSQSAYNVAEKIRGKVEKTNYIPNKTITVSIGISEYPAQTNSVTEIFGFADSALFTSKVAGRNRITIYSS